MNKLNLVCTCNEKYLKFFIPFLNSINKNTDNIRVVVRLVNVSTYHDTIIKKIHNDVHIIHDDVSLSSKRTGLTGDSTLITPIWEKRTGHGFLISEAACYCSNIKYNTINQLLDDGVSTILYMDVDAIVRKDLTELNEHIKNHDIVIRRDVMKNPPRWRNISEPNGETYRQGIFGIRNTDIVRDLFRRVEEAVTEDMNNWDIDQIAFYHIFESMEHDINFMNLPSTYRDTFHRHVGSNTLHGCYSDESHVWSGSYKSKYTEQRYIDEVDKYMLSY